MRAHEVIPLHVIHGAGSENYMGSRQTTTNPTAAGCKSASFNDFVATMQPSSKAVSAPGKVLLAGGYLVLDRAHTGLVFGLAARIHVHIQSLPTPCLEEIVVCSPQFTNATWRYNYKTLSNDGGVQVTQLSEQACPTATTPHPLFH